MSTAEKILIEHIHHYCRGTGCHHSSRADLVAGAEAIDVHVKLFGLLMHVDSGGWRSKTKGVLFHKHHNRQEANGWSATQALWPNTPLYQVGTLARDRAEWARFIARKCPH